MLANMQRLYDKMAEFNLDAVVASCPENVVYLSGHQCHRPFCFRHHQAETYAVIPVPNAGKARLVIAANDAGIISQFPCDIDDIHTYGRIWTNIDVTGPMTEAEERFQSMMRHTPKRHGRAGEALVTTLTDVAHEGRTLGLDMKNMPAETLEAVRSAFPKVLLVDAHELLKIVRMVKTPEEIALLRAAGESNERAVQAVLHHAGEGVSETELTQIYLDQVAAEGGSFEYWNTAAGSVSAMGVMSAGHFRPRSPYRLKKGDMYRYDGGSIFGKYHADAGGCACIGEPSAEVRKVHAALTKGIERVQELLRPGALPSAILREAIACVEKAGISDFGKYCFFCGHGIGLEARDHPVFTPPAATKNMFLPGSYDLPLEESMVVSIELPYGQLGLGGFQIEYTMLLTAHGAEKLYPHQRHLVVC